MPFLPGFGLPMPNLAGIGTIQIKSTKVLYYFSGGSMVEHHLEFLLIWNLEFCTTKMCQCILETNYNQNWFLLCILKICRTMWFRQNIIDNHTAYPVPYSVLWLPTKERGTLKRSRSFREAILIIRVTSCRRRKCHLLSDSPREGGREEGRDDDELTHSVFESF